MIILILQSLLYISNCDCIPYGMRLSLGHYYSVLNDINNLITLTFNSQNLCLDYVVQIISTNSIANIQVKQYQLLNMTDIYKDKQDYEMNYQTYIYTVQIGEFDIIQEGQQYTYVIYWENKLIAGPYYFQVPSKELNYSAKFIVTGDMDSNWGLNTSKETFDWFQKEINSSNAYDGIIYLGDMAYDLEDNNCKVGDDFLRNISLFTSHFPFMLTPGNHDNGENDEYTYIRTSFKTPRISDYDNEIKYNDFYSFRVGNAYFVQFHPYKIAYGNKDQTYFNYTLNQMEQELKRIRAENVSWVIVYNHYPFYCSNPDDGFCENHYEKMKLFEDLFLKYHVDLCLAGHQHTYERDEPLAYNKIAKSEKSDGNTYVKPQAPIYIVEGAAGNDEIMPTEIYPPKFYTKFQAAGDGVGILEIKNATHLYFEHRMCVNNSVVDHLWIVKDPTIPDDNDDDKDESVPKWMWIAVGVFGVLLIGTIAYFTFRKRKDATFNELT